MESLNGASKWKRADQIELDANGPNGLRLVVTDPRLCRRIGRRKQQEQRFGKSTKAD